MAWVGGKKALREEVLARFPLYYERYIEVFGGGGWVLFHKPPGTDFEVYNDLNGNLAALYRTVRDHPRELQERLRYVLNSREDFMRLKQVLEHPEGMEEVARAAAFYQVIRYSYAAGCGSFAAQPHSMWGNFPLIDKACARLQKVVVHAQVGNVDTARPTVDFHFEPLDGGDRTIITEYGKTEYYNYDLVMNASADDVGSGIERYEYKVGDGEWTVFDPTDPPKFTEEQIVHIVVRVWDVAGNVSEEKARDIVLDKTPPTASHTLTPGRDGKVNINLGTDGSICGVQSITRPDGSVAYGVDTLVFEVDRNGDYDFFVWDRCGNLLKYTVPVDSFAAPVEPEPAPSEPEEPKPEIEPEPEPAPEQEGPEAPVELPVQEDTRALTLADLACTLLSILLAILVWPHGKKDGGEDTDDEDEQVDEDVEEDEPRGYAVQKTVNAVLAVLSVVLFFLTQPLVWRFRFVDWWTVLFVLLCGTALAMLIWRRRPESATEEDTDEE